MPMIKLLDSNYKRLGNIKYTISSKRLEEINGENTLDFETILDPILGASVTEDSIYEINNDYFTTAVFNKLMNDDQTYSLSIEAEHVSYKLNNEEYNVEYFTEKGTPAYILGKVLEGTGLTVGIVEFTDEITYSTQEAKSRRQLLMEFVNYVHGDVGFSKMQVNIFKHRGSTVAKNVLSGKNVKIVSKSVDKHTMVGDQSKDANGNLLYGTDETCKTVSTVITKWPAMIGHQKTDSTGHLLYYKTKSSKETTTDVTDWPAMITDKHPTISYKCTPLYLPGDTYQLGDCVNLVQEELHIKETLRIVKMEVDPYDPTNVSMDFANVPSGITNSMYHVETNTVIKDKTYNGTRIGPEFGFEAVRSDKKARSFFRSDSMAFQTGDGTGENWKDRLYYEYNDERDETTLVFDGLLSVNTLEAMSAYIGALAADTLYASKAVIADLTVDELNTSNKVNRYINKDTSNMEYIRIYDNHIDFYTAKTDGTKTEQLKDRQNNLLYWMDATMQGITTHTTNWPVTSYVYTEKLDHSINTGDGSKWTGTNVSDSAVTFAYDDGSMSSYAIVRDADGNIISINGVPVSWNTGDGAKPILSSNSVVGSDLTLMFDSAMADPTGKQGEFAITVNDTAVTITSVSLGSINTLIDMVLSVPTKYKDVIKLTYTKGTIAGTNGGLIDSFGPLTLSNDNEVSDYQIWNVHAESPESTSDYPYQAIITRLSDPTTVLILSKYKLYNDSGYITSVRGMLKAYKQNDNGDWVWYGDNIDKLIYYDIIECNNDIYTNNLLTTVYKDKTTL